MRPRWTTWAVLLASGSAACAARQHRDVAVAVQAEEPLRGYSRGPLSLGASPGDLSAAQINAALEGHGSWVDTDAYGRVWRPGVAIAQGPFIPYVSAGRWVATDAGWYWRSDYPWGRVPFHYGRWVLDGGVWSWVPGSRFAPAWVDWRLGGGWVAWAALGPVGARAWAPFAYCTHDGLRGPGLERRVVQGAAGSSLYARTDAVPPDGDIPRGPSMSVGLGAVIAVAGAWQDETLGLPVPPVFASVSGIDSVEGIPVARSREAAPVVDAPVGGAAVVLRDRDLVGMSEGPSVRRPAGEALRPETGRGGVVPGVSVVVAAASPSRAAVAPPPLPPAPDGVGAGSSFGAYPMRAPGRFTGRLAASAPAYSEPAVVVAASPPQPAPTPAAPVGGVGVTGLWRGVPATSAWPSAPVATGGLVALP